MQQPAFLFDLDGVLTDTAHYHYAAWQELATELGMHFTKKDNERLKGVSRLRSFEIILEVNGAENRFTPQEKAAYADKKNEQYRKMIENLTPEDVLPGILPFLDSAATYNIPMAVASASRNADRVLRLLGIIDRFAFVADANTIAHPKPNPEVFLVCAAALKMPPIECIGFEDAQAGIEALAAAGMFSVGIGVEVTSIKPDLPLLFTRQLDIDAVLAAYRAH